ncbi:MAG: dTMP kinase [Oligoflexia bacterium]|nr:dTMP kinase [Oligoflexia bacterium]
MRPGSGLFITFEGTEGAGKSTLIRTLAEALPANRGVTLTREPGGSEIAEKIRGLILSQAMDPWCELFLYEAARAEHLAKTIRPALDRGEIILCDRYTDSSLAYQAHARGLDWKKVTQLNRIATQGIAPHLTVLIDIDPARGLARANDRNRFEDEGIAFQARVRQGFLKARRENPKRWLVLKAEDRNGAVPPESLAAKVIRELQKRFPKAFERQEKSPRRGRR